MFVGVAAGSLSEVWGEVQRAAGAMERLTELLQVKSNIQMPEVPVEFQNLAKGAVSFEQVNFGYPSRKMNLLSEIFSWGTCRDCWAVGAGKSTIFRLLLRFYDPHLGRIRIDGINIQS